MIVTNALYAEIDRLRARVEELEESRDSWKREWRLSNAGLDMAEKRIADLEAENHRLIVQRDGAFERWKSAIAKYPNGADGCCCLFDDNENQVQWCTPHAELRDENDALTAERDKLEADNKRLADLNDMFPQEIARLEDRVSEEYEAERADDRVRIKELEAENKRLRELVDGATEVVEISNFTFPAQREWKAAWLKKAEKTLKEASKEVEGGQMTHKISLSDIEILRLLLRLLTEYEYPSSDMRWQLIEIWAKDLIRKEASHG